MRSIFVVLLLCATAAGQQVYTVDETDPAADYQSLLTAVQNVPAGSTLLLLSDCDDTQGGPETLYYVDKDLVVLGNGAYIERGVFEIRAGADVTLKDFTSPGAIDWHAVDIDSGQLVLEGLDLSGGFEHDGVHAEGGALVVVNECTIYAPGISNAPSNAISAWGATVVLKDTVLNMGNPFWAISVMDSGGDTGTVYWTDCWTNGLIEEISGGQVVYLQRTILDSTPLQLGASATFNGEFSPYGWPGLVFLGLGVQAPVDRFNPLFLDATAQLLLVVSSRGKWSLTGTIPNDPALLGVSVYVQQLDMNTMSWSIVESRSVGN